MLRPMCGRFAQLPIDLQQMLLREIHKSEDALSTRLAELRPRYNPMIRFAAIAFALVLTQAWPAVSGEQHGSMFIDATTGWTSPTQAESEAIDRYGSYPNVLWVTPVDVEPGALDHENIRARLGDRDVMVKGKRVRPRPSTPSWQGYVALPGDHPDEKTGGGRDFAVFIANSGRIAAYIYIDQEHYKLKRLQSGRYILIKENIPPSGDVNDAMSNPELRKER